MSHRRAWSILAFACVFLFATASVATAAPTASFGGPSYLGTGYYAFNNRVGDLDNDGSPDLIVPMYDENGDGFLRTYLNNGTGNFTQSAVTTVSGTPGELADFDRDGNLDVVVGTMWSGHSLTFARGDGMGGLSVAGYLDHAYMTTYFTTGDFNGDSIPDILVGTGELDFARLYLGNGDFTFTQSAVITDIGYNSWSAQTGDINRDGNLDFVVANLGSNSIDIHLGNGSGTGFLSIPDLSVYSQPTDMLLADFNRDGCLDLAVSYMQGATVTVFDGDGSGNFTSRRDLTVPVGVNDIETADVNCDGTLDIVAGGVRPRDVSYSQSEISVMLGDGVGNFPVQVKPSYGDYWAYGLNTISVADLDGDARPDLVTSNTNSNAMNNIGILKNTSAIDHSLELQLLNTGTLLNPYRLAAGDLNRDGRTDVIVGSTNMGAAAVMLGNTGDTLTDSGWWGGYGININGLAIADADHNGVLDLFSFDDSHITSWESDGAGGFTSVFNTQDSNGMWTGVQLDANRDGYADAVGASFGSSLSRVLINDGTGSLVASQTPNMGSGVYDLATADFDHDGITDIVGGADDGLLHLAYGDGGGGFSVETTGPLSATAPWGIEAGDLNNDGDADVVFVSPSLGFRVILNDGNGLNIDAGVIPAADIMDVALADFDIDGTLDAITCSSDGIIRYWNNDGAGHFAQVDSVDTGATLRRIIALDIDRDGRPDVAASGGTSSLYTVTQDNQAPYTTLLYSPDRPTGSNDWYVTTPTVSFETNEPAETYFTLNGSPVDIYNGVDGPSPIVEGINSLSFWSVDGQGHSETTQTVAIKFDHTPPTSEIHGLPAGVSSTEVTFTITGEDALSGLGPIRYQLNGGTQALYDGTVTLSTEGTTTVRWWATDNAGNAEEPQEATVVIDLPEPPITQPDEYTMSEDGTLTVVAPGVLGNDIDPEGGDLEALLDSHVDHGHVMLNRDGSFTYTPNADWSGVDSFSYVASSDVASSTIETVTITVEAVADAPIALSLSDDTIAENLPAGSVVGTLTATDVDSTEFTYSLVGGGDADAFQISGDKLQTSEVLDYETQNSYSITVRVTDESDNTFDQAFTITVIDTVEPPVTSPDSYETDEDGTLTVAAPGVLGNDTDPDGGALVAILGTDVAHGTLALDADGGFTYEPDANWHGDDVFTYVASSAVASSTVETVTITVTSVPDTPTDMTLSNNEIAENEATGTVVGTLSTTDADSTEFTYSIVATGDADAFQMDGDEIKSAVAFDYETKSSYSVTIRVTDDTDETFEKTFAISILNIDEDPVPVDDSYETLEGVQLVIAAPGVLANDTDPEGGALRATVDQDPAHGTLVLAIDGGFTYTPDAGFHGTDTFDYVVDDVVNYAAGGTVTITVTPLDSQPPTTTCDAVASYDGEAVITLTATDDNTGVAETYWRLDGSDIETGTVVHVVTTGDHTLDFWSEDNNGNVEGTHTVEFTVTSDVSQVAGGDRYQTAILASQAGFPEGADAAVICRGDVWADVAGGSALAGAVDGPLLLTRYDAPDGELIDELDRLGVHDVYILGGEQAVSAHVEAVLADALGEGGTVTRIAGENRYGTAAAVAQVTVGLLEADDLYTGDVFLATGEEFPDAIAAAPLAAGLHRPIVLTASGGLSPEAEAALTAIGAEDVRVLGGTKAVPDEVTTQVAGLAGVASVERLSGADRYHTAISIAEYGIAEGLTWNGVAVSSGVNFPDALAGGVMQGQYRSVVLLTDPDALPPAVYGTLHANRAEIGYCRILGGEMAVSEAVRVEIHNALE